MDVILWLWINESLPWGGGGGGGTGVCCTGVEVIVGVEKLFRKILMKDRIKSKFTLKEFLVNQSLMVEE